MENIRNSTGELRTDIEANVEDSSGALSEVPDAASRIGASREELYLSYRLRRRMPSMSRRLRICA